jgi:hypothetical protein
LKLKIALIAAALAVSSSAFAADKKTSISVFGNLSGSSGADPVGTVAVSFGRLLTDSFEVGAQYVTSFSSGNTFRMGGVNAKYYFGTVGKAGAVLPYVTAAVGANGSDTSSTGHSLQAGGGAEFVMTESASTFVEAVYDRNTISSHTTNGYQMQVGIKLRF